MTVVVVPIVLLLPSWPRAVAAPEVLLARPVLDTELVFDEVRLALLVAPESAPPVETEPAGPELLEMWVTAWPMPSPEASPLTATAVSALPQPTFWVLTATAVSAFTPQPTFWVLLALAAPLVALAFDCAPVPELVELALPELAPLAASTSVTVPEVVLLPVWPVAMAAPDTFVAVPLLVTALLLVELSVTDVVPPI
ncbi:MAG: hypothetical protein ACYDAG_11945, partial [Chloroflexota bacterium]